MTDIDYEVHTMAHDETEPAHRMRAPWRRRSSDYPGWDYDGEGDGVPSLRVLAICIAVSWLAVVLLIAGLWKLLR